LQPDQAGSKATAKLFRGLGPKDTLDQLTERHKPYRPKQSTIAPEIALTKG
jgi:hypothetical protein